MAAADTITVAAVQQAFNAGCGNLGTQIDLAAAGPTRLVWVWGRRRYELRHDGKLVHHGADVEDAVAAYNTAVS
jgi:hypothetical protein